MRRQCLACNGTGCDGGCNYVQPCNLFLKDVQYERGHLECPVCLGSGKVEDRIGREDALADAATLRAYLSGYDSRPAFDLRAGIGKALTVLQHLGLTRRAAREAAHAIFRAVPGLRGK